MQRKKVGTKSSAGANPCDAMNTALQPAAAQVRSIHGVLGSSHDGLLVPVPIPCLLGTLWSQLLLPQRHELGTPI